MIPGPVQESLQFGAFISPCAQTRLSPIPVLSDPSKESPKLHEPTRPCDSSVSKKRRLPQDMPEAKRHCTSASPTGRLCTHSVPFARSSLPVIRSPRSRSTPRSFPHNRLVMDCVEVMPLRELLHRRKADAEGDDKRKQRRNGDLDDHAWGVTPSRPFMPRVRRELPERDEIGMLLSEITRKSTLYHEVNCLYSTGNTGRSAPTYSDTATHGSRIK
jgi:hypothetical protein